MIERDEVPVLIVGGGPTGLTAALLLARAGVPALLVERRPGTSIHPRARGLNVRTMEILRGLGLEDAVRAAGSALAASRYMLFVETLAGREIRRIIDDDLIATGERLASVTPCDWCQCAQDELEPILAAAARDAGAELLFGVEARAVTQDGDGVSATLAGPGGDEQTVRARYVIAADGARSPVRAALGLHAEGPTMGHYVNIYFRADLRPLVEGRWFGICFVENPAAPGLFLAVNNRDRWLFNAEYDPASGASPADFTTERSRELVRAAVGLPDLPVEILSVLPWEAAARVAERMRDGRVFLAGDAAHVMPPAGGFGLNTGLQDAHNLAWKLAAVLRGEAGAALLETYESERLPVARAIVGQAARELQAERPDGPPGPPPGAEGEAVDQQLEQLKAVLGAHYESTAVISDGRRGTGEGLDLRGRPGTRAPHVWLERDGGRISSLDLLGGRFVLLAGPAGAPWLVAAQEAATTLGLALDVYQIGPACAVRDTGGDWPAACGLTERGALLIRPDGFVGWRSADGEDQPARALGNALQAILSRGV